MRKKWKSKMSRCLAFSRPAKRTAHCLDRRLGVSMALATPLSLLCSTPSAVSCSDYDAMETKFIFGTQMDFTLFLNRILALHVGFSRLNSCRRRYLRSEWRCDAYLVLILSYLVIFTAKNVINSCTDAFKFQFVGWLAELLRSATVKWNLLEFRLDHLINLRRSKDWLDYFFSYWKSLSCKTLLLWFRLFPHDCMVTLARVL